MNDQNNKTLGEECPKQIANAEAVLENLEKVIEDIKEGNVKGSWGRKIIELGYHHPKIPDSLHLDDYFVETFSGLGYYLMNYQSSEKKEITLVEKMVSRLGEYAGNLLLTLRNQAPRFREYVSHIEEFTTKMEKVWEPKFGPLCEFLQQFVNLRYGGGFDACFIDMKTPIIKETITYTLRKLKLPE